MIASSKMIKVTSRGYVMTSRGRAFAPITRPYREDVGVIFSMLTRDRATVVEVLSDKSEITLTLQNFDKVNDPTFSVEDVKPVPMTPVTEVEPPTVEVESVQVEPTTVEPTDTGDVVSKDEIAEEVPAADAEVGTTEEAPVEEPVTADAGNAQNYNGNGKKLSRSERRRLREQLNQAKPVEATVPESV